MSGSQISTTALHVPRFQAKQISCISLSISIQLLAPRSTFSVMRLTKAASIVLVCYLSKVLSQPLDKSLTSSSPNLVKRPAVPLPNKSPSPGNSTVSQQKQSTGAMLEMQMASGYAHHDAKEATHPFRDGTWRRPA